MGEQLDTVVDAFFEVQYNGGDKIIVQGDEGDNFYIVGSGECDVYVAKGDAAPQHVFTAKPGAAFGELALMYNAPRSATVVSKGSSVLWALDRGTFRHILMSSTSDKRKQHESFLEQVPLLANLTKEERGKIADVLEPCTYSDGEEIIRQGDEGEHLYMLVSGSAVASKSTSPGQPARKVMDLAAGQYFGEVALLKNQPRSATVTAVGACHCVRIDRGAFTRLLGPCEDIMRRQMEAYGMEDGAAEEETEEEEEETAPEPVPPPAAMRARKRRSAVSAEAMVAGSDLDSGPLPVYEKSEAVRQRLKQIVSKNILFQNLDNAQMSSVLDAFFEVKYASGDNVIVQGDEGDNFYIIDEGQFDVFVQSGNAPSKQVTTLSNGKAFGELALMYNCPRAATVTASSAGVCFALDRKTFRNLVVNSQAARRRQSESFLENVPLLSNMTAEERGKVADVMEPREYMDGEYIVREGDEGSEFFIISEGEAVATKSPAPGFSAVPVMEYRIGSYFGEMALIKNQPRAANVVAKGPCRCVAIDRGAFTRLLGSCEDIMQRQMASYSSPTV